MKYQVIMYKPKNGLEKMESVISDDRPTVEFIERCVRLYGAESYKIIEIPDDIYEAFGNDCKSGECS